MNTLLFWTKLRDAVRPEFFFLGLLFGFACCCLAGKTAQESNPYEHFRRFHIALQPGTDYYPTISQMIAIAKEPLVEGKTLVIIGGNSIGFGIGQGDQLWSDQLQKDLGPSFAVRNFAMNGNHLPLGGPYLAFLSLSRFYRNIYYVTFSRPGTEDYLDASFFGYSSYWDAHYKRLLPALTIEERNIEFRHLGLTGEERTKLDETLCDAYLDSYCYFRDLWTTVAYKLFCTMWTKITGANFLLPRRLYKDVDPPIKYSAPRRFASLNEQDQLDRITFLLPAIFGNGEDLPEKVPASTFTEILEMQVANSIPENLRHKIFQVDVKCCPFFLNRLPFKEKRKYELLSDFDHNIWLKAGCHQIEVGSDYRDDDYIDALHLSPEGGVKLANTVAEVLLKETTRN